MAFFGVVNAVGLEVFWSSGLKSSRDTNDHYLSLPEAFGDRRNIALPNGQRDAKPFVVTTGLEKHDARVGGDISVEAGKHRVRRVAGHTRIDDFDRDLPLLQ
jgi:hypothetical protein